MKTANSNKIKILKHMYDIPISPQLLELYLLSRSTNSNLGPHTILV